MTTYVVAIDIGGTKIAAALANSAGQLLHRRQAATPQAGGPSVIAEITRMVTALRGVAEGAGDEVIGVGIGSAGVIDAEGTISSATDLISNWAGTKLGAEISYTTGLPVRVLNDVHATGLAEARFGAARGAANVVVVAVGTGIGGALIHGGEVMLGRNFVAGGLGHVRVCRDDVVRICSCGIPQHVEAYSSGPAMELTYRELTGTALDLRQILRLAGQGDEDAAAALRDGARMLGLALGTINNIIDPDLIIIGGGVSAALEHMRPVLTEAMLASSFTVRLSPPIKVAQLGADACLVGAGIIGWEGATV